VSWDARYKPFRPISEWPVRPREKAWRKLELLLRLTQNAASEHPRLALEPLARVVAADRAARAMAVGECDPLQLDRMTAGIIASYNRALDLATGRAVISESWIRQLHAIVCDGQEVQSDSGNRPAAGPRPHAFQLSADGRALEPNPAYQARFCALLKGEYRTNESYMWIPRNRRRYFSPPCDIPGEVRRLVAELNSEAFTTAHPALQAAFAHYALVAVHPFQDGNGRTSRVLASIYTLRSHLVLPLILSEHGGEYASALRRANAGEYAPFVDFIVRRCLGAVTRCFARELSASLSKGETLAQAESADDAAPGLANQIPAEILGEEYQRKADDQCLDERDEGSSKTQSWLHSH
jgi:hypothetical protein